jgi:D-proline reductase (dithiol) PrdB
MAFRHVEYTDVYQKQYADWLERADLLHHRFVARENHAVSWTPLGMELPDARVAFVTTAGVHPRAEEPFDDEALEGDPSFRIIPGDVASQELMVTHNHYDHSDADKDINCLFPLDRLRELTSEGIVGELSDEFYGFMGFNPQPDRIIANAEEVASSLTSAEVDVVLLSPG